MRAAYMTDVNAVQVGDAEEPKLDPRGAILKVEACGICGTDARTFFNGDPQAPVPVGARSRAGRDARGGRPRRGPPPRRLRGRPGVPGFDPHVR